MINKHMYIYSPAGIVNRSPSIIVCNIGITVSFSHQAADYIEKSKAGVKNSGYQVGQTYMYL